MVSQPTVISLFSGCGGSSLGYKWAGYKELLAIDFEKNAVDTFRLNFPEIPCWQRDIREVIGQEILDFCKIKKGDLDLLDGSPPCQGFSTAGKRKVTDPRNDLFREYVRLINDLSPKVFVMENVSGMAKGTMKGIFNEVLRTLRGCGYQVKCKLMNAKWYGVPQSRERVIFIGVKDGKPSFPKPTRNIITVRQAIADCPVDSPVRNILKPDRYRDAREGQPLYKTYSHAYRRLWWDRVAGTVTRGSHQIHPIEDRELSGREISRLASFPDTFQFIGRHQEWVDRIGNAVMPKFMEAIASHIKETILQS